jgi:acetylornithine deacetylase/succinyl-diaminopimelate desuccinylase-like protein
MTPAGADAARFAADLIRIDTTNRGGGDARERPAAEYVAARLAEAGLEPVLLESAPGRANVVARIAGGGDETSAGAAEGALLLHGHLDVVPADPADWSVHPFSGEIRDGVLWGRGAVDMKNADAVLIALAGDWARTGRGPRRDIVLAFTADEEDTAQAGSRWLVERHPELFEGCTEAVGESGAFTFHAGPGRRLYPIASAERGTAWLKLTARGRAGAAALPDRLGRAGHRLAEADRARPGRARLQAERRERGDPAGRGGSQDRRLPVAGPADPDGARRGRGHRRRGRGPPAGRGAGRAA